jgi:hypothetical protein
MTEQEKARLERALSWRNFLLRKIQPLVSEDTFESWMNLI